VLCMLTTLSASAHCSHLCVRYQGSAGGTFIRIPFGKKKQLLVGSMVLLGKHQFKVAAIDPMRRSDSKEDRDRGEGEEDCESSVVSKSSSLEAIVGDAEALLLALEELNVSSGGGGGGGEEGAGREKARLQARMQRLREAASALSTSPLLASSSPPKEQHYNQHQHKGSEHKGFSKSCKGEDEEDDEEGADEVHDAGDMRLQLICFAPEGSPLIGVSYHVGRGGASLGRAKSNGISLMLEDRSIDNSVSQEHAHIEMDKVRDRGGGAICMCVAVHRCCRSTHPHYYYHHHYYHHHYYYHHRHYYNHHHHHHHHHHYHHHSCRSTDYICVCVGVGLVFSV
jgi:hypothetical protein